LAGLDSTFPRTGTAVEVWKIFPGRDHLAPGQLLRIPGYDEFLICRDDQRRNR
jgi:hypothetical protein